MTKILIDRCVLEQALEALNASMPHNNDMDEDWPSHIAARRALRAALEQPQVEQEPFTVLVRKRSWLANQWEAAPCGFPDYGKQWADERINVYIHPQNLNCKSNQARLATLWGYEKPQPPRQPLTDEQIRAMWCQFAPVIGGPLDFARAIERAHGIGGEA